MPSAKSAPPPATNVVAAPFRRGQGSGIRNRDAHEKTRAARMARGTFPPLKSLPGPPAVLDEQELSVWNLTGRQLVSAGLLTGPLALVLVDYCRAVAQSERHASVLREQSLVRVSRGGVETANARVAMWTRSVKLCAMLREQLGLVGRSEPDGAADADDDLSGQF